MPKKTNNFKGVHELRKIYDKKDIPANLQIIENRAKKPSNMNFGGRKHTRHRKMTKKRGGYLLSASPSTKRNSSSSGVASSESIRGKGNESKKRKRKTKRNTKRNTQRN